MLGAEAPRKAKVAKTMESGDLAWKTTAAVTLGFATALTNDSDRSTARTRPKARLTYFPQDDRISKTKNGMADMERRK